ncbi:DUF4149 domain-containing protein [Neisseriaceae bacterium B1]
MGRVIALLTSVWLGMHIGFGYIAAPVLFKNLERLQAGNMAGTLFHWANWVGLVAWALAFVLCRQDRARSRYRPVNTHRGVLFLWLLLAINEFLMTPVIEALKTNQKNWLHDLIGGSFGMWHGMSSVIHLLAAITGLVLCLMVLRWREMSR